MFRAEILNFGLKGFDKIVKAEQAGVRPMFRPKGWNETSRWLAKRRKKNHPYVSVALSQELLILASLCPKSLRKVHPADQRPLTATAS